MSFLKKLDVFLGTKAKQAIQYASNESEKLDDIKQLASEWSYKDKDFIMNAMKNGNRRQKIAAGMVAKQNGWLNKN